MSSRWRRFDVLLPLQFNDGREIPAEWLAEAVLEIVDQFGAASYETQKVEGHWRHSGIVYRDNLVKIVIDVPDSAKNRAWMKGFKARWKGRLEQLELWMVSHRIEVEYQTEYSIYPPRQLTTACSGLAPQHSSYAR